MLPDLSRLRLDRAESVDTGVKRYLSEIISRILEKKKPDRVDENEVKQAFAKLSYFLRMSTPYDHRSALMEHMAITLQLECVIAFRATAPRAGLFSLRPVDMQGAQNPFHETARRFFDAVENAWKMVHDSEKGLILYRAPGEDPVAPVTDISYMKTIARKTARCYFNNIRRKEMRISKIESETAQALTKISLPESVVEVHVTFVSNGLERTRVTSGMFTPLYNSKPNIDERAQLLEGDDQIQTVEYDRASFMSNQYGQIGSLCESISVVDFARLSSETLADLAHKAESRFSFCTFVEWKRALQQIYIQSQTTRSSSPLSKFPTKRLTNKMMTTHETTTTAEMQWSVHVTLTHAQKGVKRTKTDLRVTVSEDLRGSMKRSTWNHSLFYYKGGDKMLYSDTLDDALNEFRSEFVYETTPTIAFQIKYFQDKDKDKDKENTEPDAKAVLQVNYEEHLNHVRMTNISVRQPESSTDNCVSVQVSERSGTMYLASLFYGLTEQNRELCQVSVGKKGEKRGAGAVILKALTSIGASLGFKIINLSDAACFVDVASMPYFGRVYITPYLRALRGFGYYEGMGFFSTNGKFEYVKAHEQAVLNFFHKLYTTKIKDLRLMTWQLKPWEDNAFDEAPFHNIETYGEVESLLNNLDNMWDDRSMRSILQEFIDLTENVRPRAEKATSTEQFLTEWETNLKNRYESFANLEKAAACIAVAFTFSSIDSFTSHTKCFKYVINSSGLESVATHLVVVPSEDGSAPKAVEKLIDYNFECIKLM